MKKKWLEKLLIQSICFALFLFVLFFSTKLCFLLYMEIFHSVVGEVKGFGEYVNTFINGLRYDACYVAFFSILYFIIGIVFFWRELSYFVLWIYAFLSVLFITFLSISEIVFYEVFDNIFDSNLLRLFFDDRKAIFHTGMSGQYTLTLKIIIWILLSFVFMWIYTKIFSFIESKYRDDPLNFIRFRHPRESPAISIVLFAVFVFFMMICINSSLGFRNVSLDQVVRPIENDFLRKISAGAFRDLYLVYRGYMKISSSKFSDYTSQSPLDVVREYFGLDSQQEEYDLRDLLAKKVDNVIGENIEHVFYIIVESLSEWHFNADFDEIDLTSGLKSLLHDSHGAKIGVFLENAASTIKSMDVHFTGLLQTEIPVNSMLGTLEPFITAPGQIMKNLGYKTNFYYGGSGIWQKIEQYATSQGFEKIYHNTQIIDNAKLNAYSFPYEGLWGAYDHHLFSLVRDNVFKERSYPSFNMLLTTSNHPPYDVPLEQFNAPLEKIQTFFSKHTQYKEKNYQMIAHIWYQDKMITRFIHEVSRILPNSLFIITGSHYDREYPKAEVPLKISNTVPLILYSPILEIKKTTNIGSHIDITSSMLELVAPNNYIYHSFGIPLVNNNNIALSEKNSALGYFVVATDRFVSNKNGEIEYFHDGIAQSNDKEFSNALHKRLQQATALSWWILKNGYKVNEKPDSSY